MPRFFNYMRKWVRNWITFCFGQSTVRKQKPSYFNRGNFTPAICYMDDAKVENPNVGVEAININNYRKWLQPLLNPRSQYHLEGTRTRVVMACRSLCYRGNGWLVGAGASVKMQPLQRCHLKQKARGRNTLTSLLLLILQLGWTYQKPEARSLTNTILSETEQSKERVENRYQRRHK